MPRTSDRQPPRRSPRRGPGFTLVELLVVVGIIAVIIALVLPAMARARNTAARVACLSTLRQFGIANHIYLVEFKDWYVPVKWGFDPTPAPGWPGPPPGLVPATIAHQAWPRNWVFRKALGLNPHRSSRVPYNLVCPKAVLAVNDATRDGHNVARSYGYNATGLGWYTGATIYYTGYHRAKVRVPSRKIMFADSTGSVVGLNSSTRYDLYGETWGPPPRNGAVAYRHERGANVVFFDGHGEYCRRDEIGNRPQVWQVMK